MKTFALLFLLCASVLAQSRNGPLNLTGNDTTTAKAVFLESPSLVNATGLRGVYNASALKSWYASLAYATGNITNFTSQTGLRVMIFGDSWTQNDDRYTKAINRRLSAKVSNPASAVNPVMGWCSWANTGTGINGCASAAEYVSAMSIGANWYNTLGYTNNFATPDICAVGYKSGAGATCLATVNGGCQSGDTLNFMFLKSAAAGTVRVSVNNGSTWSFTNNLAGSVTNVVSSVVLGANPPFTVQVQATTTSADGSYLAGMWVVPATRNYVQVHKLGATGSYTLQWLAPNATQWEASVAAVGADVVVIVMGTNDQAPYTASVFQGYLTTFIGQIQTALPGVPVVFACSPENLGGSAHPMVAYAAAAKSVCSTLNCGFVDLQPWYGILGTDYTTNNPAVPYPWYDTLHPYQGTRGCGPLVEAVASALGL